MNNESFMLNPGIFLIFFWHLYVPWYAEWSLTKLDKLQQWQKITKIQSYDQVRTTMLKGMKYLVHDQGRTEYSMSSKISSNQVTIWKMWNSNSKYYYAHPGENT